MIINSEQRKRILQGRRAGKTKFTTIYVLEDLKKSLPKDSTFRKVIEEAQKEFIEGN
jgi:hypothetical protein